MSWIELAPIGAEHILCPRCGQRTSTEVPFIDHHISECTSCSARTFWWSFGQHHVRVSVDDAHPSFKHFLLWANEELDEVEFLELMVVFEEIFEPTSHGEIAEKLSSSASKTPDQ